jgi:hypothetical protein
MNATARFALPALALAAGLAAVQTAEAKPNITRKGGQWGVTLGGAICVPGQAKCSRDNVEDGGVTIDGKARPSFGMGAELGYRFKPWIFAGAAYNLGFLDTTYEVSDGGRYKRGYQNSVYGIVKPILPVWRFDFGLGMGPGFSRQVFVERNGAKDYSQGFSWIMSPSIDIWVARRIFVGAKVDLLLNAHNKRCREDGDSTNCTKAEQRDLAPVHQMVFGLHIGGTFL